MSFFVLCHNQIFSLAQSVLHSACGVSANIFCFDYIVTSVQSYVRATRYIMPSIFNALSKGNDPDRIKGALYVLGNKGTGMWFYRVFQDDLI
jgi:proteasome activator subunit 4